MVCFNCETRHVYGTHKRNIFCKCLGMVSIHFHEFHQRTDSIALKHITQFVCVYVCVCVVTVLLPNVFLFFSDRKNPQPRKPCRQECSIGKYLHFVFSPAGAMNFRTLITRTTRAVNLFTCSSPDKLEGLTNHSKQQCGKTMNVCFFAVWGFPRGNVSLARNRDRVCISLHASS